METLGSRLKALRRQRNLTQQKIADALGVSKTSVIYWEKDENVPKHESLIALARTLGTTTEWLLSGVGVPEKSNADIAKMEVGIYQAGDPVPDGYVAIDYYDDVFVSAGNGYLNLEKPSNNKMLFPVDLIKECNVEPATTKVIHVRGESMFPKLKDGQAISIDMSARTIYDGEIYAFQVGDDTKIKYLFNWSDEGKGGFKAVSANPDKNQFPDEYYSPSRIESEGITILGQYWWKQVVKRIRR
ncbi:LexA family transcriptional regulator [Acinetobacter johnsonii]|uniref:XRE family transcriptional regulator n=1 Tax=Acinetobacter johnsonii TaxID=40214 RepID=UPI002449C872|nr:LexA family transcriptional regulator [Acinetobacter johnsonii]MDH1240795.1 LexA family transcriptional regulator [Acinetobacter johnsonii]